MICSHCSEDNLIIAKYCCGCGHPFSDEERQAAYDETIYGKIDKAREIKDIVTLSVVTESIWFRALTLVLILALGVWLRMSGAGGFRLEPSDEYKVSYLESTDTYYLIAHQDTVPLRLVAPHGTKELAVEELDEAGVLVATRTYAADDGVTLPVSGLSHYRLTTSDGRRQTGELVLYLYSDSH